MISIVEEVRLPAPPERAWEFFRQMDSNYRRWHREHLEWRTIAGEPLSEGATVFVDEWVGRMRVASRMFIEDVRPNRHFAYRFTFPPSLVGAGGWFHFEPDGDGGCLMTQETHLGFRVPVLGALLDAVLGLFVPLREIARHMREEQANLARLLVEGG